MSINIRIDLNRITSFKKQVEKSCNLYWSAYRAMRTCSTNMGESGPFSLLIFVYLFRIAWAYKTWESCGVGNSTCVYL